MVLNSHGSVLGGAGNRGSFSGHPGVLQDLLMERDVQSLETALGCPRVTLLPQMPARGACLSSSREERLSCSSILEGEPEEEQVRGG